MLLTLKKISYRILLLLISIFVAKLSVANTTENEKAYKLFGNKNLPSIQNLNSIGSYSKGCLAGGRKLPETGKSWQVMRLSRNRNWGHENALKFIEQLSSFASSLNGWKGLYIGDISQPRGGPFKVGHTSHQTGLDVDIWLLPAKDLKLSEIDRENISSISVKTPDSKKVNFLWTQQHRDILENAARNPLVDRIFINAVAKIDLCENTKTDRSWLQKLRPWYGHDSHFHVRLKCPTNAQDCITQIPTVDNLSGNNFGCNETLTWWVTDYLKPKKPPTEEEKRKLKLKRTPRDFTMLDLPKLCQSVINAE
tara:strand:+ start:450 stop:1376 length:927 start_codon:yes stop_codon:yes gene_type:complete